MEIYQIVKFLNTTSICNLFPFLYNSRVQKQSIGRKPQKLSLGPIYFLLLLAYEKARKEVQPGNRPR